MTETSRTYADALFALAAETGAVKGTSETAFSPDTPVTREQLAAMLFRYAGLHGIDCSGRDDLRAFSDQAQVSAYARDAMSWAVEAGLIQGKSGGRLAPRETATRAQIAMTLYRYCETTVKED